MSLKSLMAIGAALPPPVNTVLPVVSGSVMAGQTLSCSTGTWTGIGVSYTYQWQYGTTDIPSATSSSYVISATYVGYTLRCAVTGTNGSGSVIANSANTATVTPAIGQTAYTSSGTYSWTCPEGVTSVSVVCVGSGSFGGTSAAGAAIGNNSSFHNVCVAGGGGGGGAAPWGGVVITGTGGAGGHGVNGAGGGGAGGYSGAGGNGGGGNGAGGGGGGGNIVTGSFSGGGGGVGLLGQGTSGTGGVNAGAPATGGSGGESASVVFWLDGGRYGGGGGHYQTVSGWGGAGGALAYTNNISVTPNTSYQVVVGAAPSQTSYGTAGGGAVRIIWPGTTRQFPSTNTGDM